MSPGLKHHDRYRVAVREMINLTSERSFVPALIPPSVRHVHTVRSLAFSSDADLLNFYAFSISLIADAYYKMTGREHFTDSDAQGIIWTKIHPAAIMRSLRLACLTERYSGLWEANCDEYVDLPWSSSHPSIAMIPSHEAHKTWSPEVGIRSEYARRMALVEVDVLVAMSLNMSLQQLLEVYKIYFPVLQKKERNTFYDRNGRIVWISAKGSENVGLLNRSGKKIGRSEFNAILSSGELEVSCDVLDDTMPDGPRSVTRRFVGPFTQCDRIEDYRRAWAHFERLKSEEAA